MTTIAYDGECIAVDSRSSLDGIVATDNAMKVRPCGTVPGFLILAGTSTYNELMAEEFEPGEDAHSDVDGVGFYVNEHGLVFAVGVQDGRYVTAKTKFYGTHWAFGSGANWAIAAMDHGKSAVDAIRYAMTRDTYTGGAIRRLDLKTLKVRTYKR